MKQLAGSDELWFSLETPKSPMHLTPTNVYDPSTAAGGKVSFEDIVKYVKGRLDAVPLRLKRVPVPFNLDYSYWIEDEMFDLDYHNAAQETS